MYGLIAENLLKTAILHTKLTDKDDKLQVYSTILLCRQLFVFFASVDLKSLAQSSYLYGCFEMVGMWVVICLYH